MVSSHEERLVVENIVHAIHNMPADADWPYKRCRNGTYDLPLPTPTSLSLFMANKRRPDGNRHAMQCTSRPYLLDETVTFVSARIANHEVHFSGVHKDAILAALYEWELRSLNAHTKIESEKKANVFKEIWKTWSRGLTA